MDDLLDKLDGLASRTRVLMHELDLDLASPHGFQFSATGIGAAASGFLYLSVEVETADGLRVVIGRRYHGGPSGAERFDVDAVMSGLATTLSALSAETSNGERREQLLEAVESSFAKARSEGLPIRMTALLQKPLRIGDTDCRISFELLSTMLRDDLTRGDSSMTVTDAADFTRILQDEVIPEQQEFADRLRERHARLRE